MTIAKRRTLLDRLKARFGRLHAQRLTRQFFRAAERATATQDELLAELITRGARGAFGREHHFRRTRGYDDFRANVPIRTYEQFSPYIERVRRGDVAALFSPNEKILMFALTSGTTAEPKYIPITPRVLADWRRGWNIWGVKSLLDHYGCFLRHIVQITSPMDDHLAPSGVPCGAITGLLAATQKRVVLRYYTAPLAVSKIRDSRAKYYAIMRLAVPKDVAWMVTANPATLLLLAKTADQHRETLIRDIHDGTLWNEMPIDGPVRAALAPRLTRDPAAARRLERIVAQHDALVPRNYWQLGYLAHWTGGTMGLYASQFPPYFGDTPSRDIGLIASEGRMSIPIDDGTAAGILAVTSQFFEFIPAEEYGTSRPTTLRSNEVVAGGEYFLLLTNSSGLYRYDLGDRVRVADFFGQAPLIEFLSRDAHTASLAGEKLTENQVVLAMQRVLADAKTPKRQTIDIRRSEGQWQAAKTSKHEAAGAMRGTPGTMEQRSAATLFKSPNRQTLDIAARRQGQVAKSPNLEPLLDAECPGRSSDSLLPFVVAPRWGEVPRYRLYVERSAAERLPALLARFDAALCDVNVEYAEKRRSLRLEAVEVATVPDGLLAERDRRLRAQRTRTAEQFKHQYLLSRPGADGDLEEATWPGAVLQA